MTLSCQIPLSISLLNFYKFHSHIPSCPYGAFEGCMSKVMPYRISCVNVIATRISILHLK